ncbi:MAG: hypothetical protein BJ554DRAFT_7720 [Olpidium bornovanus]|uniref:Uncharacterized protein n=1 Tax=Olpidium bornovanus TaxID=278681 RepID=A0A8H8DJL9_9FUNG|nr:MAG: hypothetical protein BJ554DRAFT_7720 [Olpidium bornovanus]
MKTAALARGREAARKECVDSFRKPLSRLVNGDGGVAQPLPRPDRYTPWQSPGQQPRKVFSAQEALLVVDYFCKSSPFSAQNSLRHPLPVGVLSYIQHIRLIECAFTQHQAVDTKARRLSLEKVAVPPPLSTGMPEEHWLEHLKQEEERRQMEAAEQQARLQALQEEALLASYRNKEVKFQDENDGAHVSTSTGNPYQQPMPPPPVLPEDRPMRSTSDVTSLAVSVASSHLDALTAHFQGYLQHDHRQHVERLQRVQEMAKKDPTSGASPAPSAPAPGAEKAASPAPAGKTRVKSAKDSPGK